MNWTSSKPSNTKRAFSASYEPQPTRQRTILGHALNPFKKNSALKTSKSLDILQLEMGGEMVARKTRVREVKREEKCDEENEKDVSSDDKSDRDSTDECGRSTPEPESEQKTDTDSSVSNAAMDRTD